jgi:hypothetical protein
VPALREDGGAWSLRRFTEQAVSEDFTGHYSLRMALPSALAPVCLVEGARVDVLKAVTISGGWQDCTASSPAGLGSRVGGECWSTGVVRSSTPLISMGHSLKDITTWDVQVSEGGTAGTFELKGGPLLRDLVIFITMRVRRGSQQARKPPTFT